MTLSNFIGILWATNAAVDARTPAPFTFEDLFESADQKQLLEFLSSKDREGFILAAKQADKGGELEEALHYAAGALEGQELKKGAVGCNPWCMVTAIVLEAIAQNFPMRLPAKPLRGDEPSSN